MDRESFRQAPNRPASAHETISKATPNFANKVLKNKFGSPLFEPGSPYHHPMADFLYETEMPDLAMNFEANDPLLDQDPFFLRAQSWKNSEKAAGYDSQSCTQGRRGYSLRYADVTPERKKSRLFHVLQKTSVILPITRRH